MILDWFPSSTAKRLKKKKKKNNPSVNLRIFSNLREPGKPESGNFTLIPQLSIYVWYMVTQNRISLVYIS